MAVAYVELTGPEQVVEPILDEQQRALVSQGRRAQLIIGPAGSGKTTVLLASLAMAAGDHRGRVLGLVPSYGAVRRWRAILASWTGREAPAITTPHAHALRLVHGDAERRGAEPPRLLSAADQLAVVADVLAASRPEAWPALYRDALATRRFADRVRDFIARAARNGWDPDRLAHADVSEAWPAIAGVWRQYRRVLALSGAMDYADLLQRATDLAASGAAGPLRLIAIEDYADLDAQQTAFVGALASPPTRVLATADPDQVVDQFRGAAEHAALDFARVFPDAGPPVLLTASHRFGPDLEAARLGLAASLPLAGLPGAIVRDYRRPRLSDRRTTIDVVTYPDAYAEAAGVAGLLRRFATGGRSEGEEPRWRDAAVLVRTGEQLAQIEQALAAAGIPVAAAAGGRRLFDEPVVRLLMTGLQLACRSAGVPTAAPDPALVVELAVSPAGGADPVELRRLLQAVRQARLGEDSGPAAGPGEILEAVLADPAALLAMDPRRYAAVRPVTRLQQRLDAAAAQVRAGDSAAEILWTLWSDAARGPGRWADQLSAVALRRGPGATAAHRALDAVLALFAEARRSPARGGRLEVAEFLAALPAMPWPQAGAGADAGRIRNAVELLTAHRARGREWPLTVVAGVQEGAWPAEAGGLGLLGEELLEPGGSSRGAREEHIAAERRLFALACTRAREHLVVSAVAASDWDPGGPQPSRFLGDLGIVARAADPERGRAATPVDLVARARRLAGDPAAPEPVRIGAAARLGSLARDPDFPWANPERWWALAQRSAASVPMLAPTDPAVLSVTALSELAECPRRWLLVRVLGASRPADSATGVGRLVHRIHEGWINGEIARDMAAAEEVVDRVWGTLPFAADWYARRRRGEVLDALLRLLTWQESNGDRLAFAERSFEIDTVLPDGSAVRLRGTADVGLRDFDGKLAVLDVKTAKSTPTRAEVARHVQLAGYQWAVRHGGLADPAESGAPSDPAGAALLLASVPDRSGGDHPKVLWQPPLDPSEPADRWFEETLASAAAGLRSEEFPAKPSASCRTCPVVLLCPVRSPQSEVGP